MSGTRRCGLGKGGVKIAPVLLVGAGAGEIDIAGGAVGIGGDGLAGEVLGLGVMAVAVAVEDGSEIDEGAVEARIELHGAAQHDLNFRQRTLLHLQEGGFGMGSVGGIDLVDLLERFASFGFGAADDGGGLLVESHGFLRQRRLRGSSWSERSSSWRIWRASGTPPPRIPNLSALSPRVSASWQ